MRFHDWITKYEMVKMAIGQDSVKAAAKRRNTDPVTFVYAKELDAIRPSAKRGGDSNRLCELPPSEGGGFLAQRSELTY